jgi:hypothetical protein
MLPFSISHLKSAGPTRHLLSYSDFIVMHFLLTQALFASSVIGSLLYSHPVNTLLAKRDDVTCGVAGDAT